jgi:hypothetical protein
MFIYSVVNKRFAEGRETFRETEINLFVVRSFREVVIEQLQHRTREVE